MERGFFIGAVTFEDLTRHVFAVGISGPLPNHRAVADAAACATSVRRQSHEKRPAVG
jgi:hypothetical protein